MRRIRLPRPSPAMAVSLIALFFALGGGAYALTLPNNSVGSAQLRANAVVNSRIFPGAVSNSKMGRTAVTFSKLADHQFTAQKIRNGSLVGANLAPNTITGAQVDESTLAITKFALVTGTGSIATQSGGVSVTQAGSRTILNFGSSMGDRAQRRRDRGRALRWAHRLEPGRDRVPGDRELAEFRGGGHLRQQRHAHGAGVLRDDPAGLDG